MRIAIVSNGPSARYYRHEDRAHYDAVIGVNYVAGLCPVDYWSAIDWETLCRVKTIGQPTIFTRLVTQKTMAANATPGRAKWFERRIAAGGVIWHEGMKKPALPDHCPPWNCYSGTSAIVLAVHLLRAAGSKELTIYGMDMAGDNDCVNHSQPTTRSNGRWHHERLIWDGLREHMVAHGVDYTVFDAEMASLRREQHSVGH